MPKRTTSEPPLPKGLACARCKARKVKCNGGPGPCNSCLRTARFRGHDVAKVTCAYHGEGRCSEDIDVDKVGVHVKGAYMPAARPPAHAKAPSRRTTSGSSVTFESTLSVGPPPPAFYYPTPQASASPQFLSSSFPDLYNFSPANHITVPPHSPSTSTFAPTISARRAGAQSMKIDLSPASFLLPNSLSAPPASPSNWTQSLESFIAGSPASYTHSSSSLSTSSVESHPTKTRDDFYTLPYPSPSIPLGNSYGASPLQSVPFLRSASGGTVSLAATPLLGGLWDSPSWEVRKEYWMDLS